MKKIKRQRVFVPAPVPILEDDPELFSTSPDDVGAFLRGFDGPCDDDVEAAAPLMNIMPEEHDRPGRWGFLGPNWHRDLADRRRRA